MEADVSEDVKPNETTPETAVSRREFGAVSLAAGLAAVAGASAANAAEHPLTETDVMVKTPDGNCDTAFIHPTTGIYPRRHPDQPRLAASEARRNAMYRTSEAV
jgi:hypothetical protein